MTTNTDAQNARSVTRRDDEQNQGGECRTLQLVTFEVGDEEFAIDILPVQEIVRMMTITRMPKSPPSVEGVVNLRGQITPVVDLRKRFGLPAREPGAESRIVVVEVQGRVIGFTVDRVNEVLELSESVVDPTPSLAGSVDRAYLRGVAKLDSRLLIMLDLEKLFEAEDEGWMPNGEPEAAETREAA